MLMLDSYAVKRNLTLEDYEAPLGAALSASAEQTWLENQTSAISRLFELNQARPERYEPGMTGDYSPDKAFIDWMNQEKAANLMEKEGVQLEIPEQGISHEKLDVLIQRKREEIKRQAISAMGPQGFGAGALKLGTALAVSLADPINIASAFVPIVSQARMAKLTGALGVTGGRVATGVIEGTVGAALVEPIVYKAMTAEQADYDLYDSYLNVTIGGVLGGGLHVGLGAIGDVIAKRSAQTKVDLLRAAIGQAADNKPIDVTRVADAHGLSDEITSKAAVDAEIERIRAELEPEAQLKLARGDRLAMEDEIKNLEYDRAQLEAQKASLDAKKEGFNMSDEVARINEQISAIDARSEQIKTTFEADARYRQAEGDLSRLDAGIIPDRYKQRVEAVKQENASRLYDPTNVPNHSREADPVASKEATERLQSAPETTPEAVDAETDQIMQSLDEAGIDTAALKAEISAINNQTTKETNGMKAAVLCMLGVA